MRSDIPGKWQAAVTGHPCGNAYNSYFARVALQMWVDHMADTWLLWTYSRADWRANAAA